MFFASPWAVCTKILPRLKFHQNTFQSFLFEWKQKFKVGRTCFQNLNIVLFFFQCFCSVVEFSGRNVQCNCFSMCFQMWTMSPWWPEHVESIFGYISVRVSSKEIGNSHRNPKIGLMCFELKSCQIFALENTLRKKYNITTPWFSAIRKKPFVDKKTINVSEAFDYFGWFGTSATTSLFEQKESFALIMIPGRAGGRRCEAEHIRCGCLLLLRASDWVLETSGVARSARSIALRCSYHRGTNLGRIVWRGLFSSMCVAVIPFIKLTENRWHASKT